MAELNETAVTENKMDWVDDGIPELQENPAENEVIELVVPRVKVDLKRYDELISKEALLDAVIRQTFADSYLSKSVLTTLLGDFIPQKIIEEEKRQQMETEKEQISQNQEEQYVKGINEESIEIEKINNSIK